MERIITFPPNTSFDNICDQIRNDIVPFFSDTNRNLAFDFFLYESETFALNASFGMEEIITFEKFIEIFRERIEWILMRWINLKNEKPIKLVYHILHYK